MKSTSKKIRYAVVGLGHIAQSAVLPAFAHATENSELVALVSDDARKLGKLAKKYGGLATFHYDELDQCLAMVDAIYIALPNHLHARFAIRAAQAGVHVLCEKPMATSVAECEQMIAAARDSDIKLMIAYRLHFEEASLRAIELAKSGGLGELRLFSSVFSAPVTDRENIRLRADTGGGTVPDIGIYCINAARGLFRDEPILVQATEVRGTSERFSEVAEMTSAYLLFPNDRIATFTCTFGGAKHSSYELVGTAGVLSVSPAFDYAGPITHRLQHHQHGTEQKTFAARDQFAPELVHFSDCVLTGKQPGPSGWEGLADVRVIAALRESVALGRAVDLPPYTVEHRPDASQAMRKPPVKEPPLVNAQSPSGQ